MAEFQFLLTNGSFITYKNWEDVPEDLELKHVIKFLPDSPPEPHTEEQHKEMEMWNDRLQKLLERERAGSN